MTWKYARNPEATWEDLGGRIVVALEEHRWFALDGTAAFIWRALELPKNIDEIVRETQARFSGMEHEMRKDIQETLEGWLSEKLVTQSHA